MGLDADTRQGCPGIPVPQSLLSDVPSHRIGPRRRPFAVFRTPVTIYALERRCAADCAESTGQAPPDVLLRRGVRCLHYAWRPDDVAGHRRCTLVIAGAGALSNWGLQRRARIASLPLTNALATSMYVANPGGRPYDTAYAFADHCHHQRHAAAYRRSWRRCGARHQAANRRKGVELPGVQAGHQPVWPSAARRCSCRTATRTSTAAARTDCRHRWLADGDIKTTKWAVRGTEFAFSSPILDGKRLYQIDSGSTLFAFDAETGAPLWDHRSAPRRRRRRPSPTARSSSAPTTDSSSSSVPAHRGGGVERSRAAEQHRQLLRIGGHAGTDSGRSRHLTRPRSSSSRAMPSTRSVRGGHDPGGRTAAATTAAAPAGAPAYVQVVPTELVLEPGQTVKLRVRVFDDKGPFIREEKATWALEGLQGTVTDGAFTVAKTRPISGGTVKATVGASAARRACALSDRCRGKRTSSPTPKKPPRPGLDQHGRGPLLHHHARQQQGAVQGAPNETLFKRIRSFSAPPTGPTTPSRPASRCQRRRQLGTSGSPC